MVLWAGYLLMGSACFAAGDVPGSTPATPVADHATEQLLRTIVLQISDGRIISPSDDNAMQTWQRVLQRDIATQGSPEVRKALEDFDTYARARAADAKAAGRLLVAAELTVFADQASRMTGRIPALDPPDTSDMASSATPPGQSGGSATPAGATDDESPQARSTAAATGATSPGLPAGTLAGTAGVALSSAAAGTAIAAPEAANGEVQDARSAGDAASPTKAATGTVRASRSAGGIASLTQAVMRMAPQTLGTTPNAVDTTGDAGSPTRSAGITPVGAGPSDGGVRAMPQGDTAALVRAAPYASADGPVPAKAGQTTTLASLDAVQGSSTGTTAAATGVPFEQLAGQLRAIIAAPAVAGGGTNVAEMPSSAVPVVGGTAITVAQPAPESGNALSTVNNSGAPQPPAVESAMAAFYAARGDAMLAHRDISAARKFYEYAANAGSARAAAALARTYDPAFAAQLGEVGLRPDPGLAAVWYRKATELGGTPTERGGNPTELGGNPAQLSQSGDTGK